MSEHEHGRKWDRCLSDVTVKFGAGLAVGLVFSVIFFKRRAWPVVFGAGSGFGMAYSNCQRDFQKPYLVHGAYVQDDASSATTVTE